MTNFPLTVYTQVNGLPQTVDLASFRLCQERKIHIWAPITAELAETVVAQLEYVDRTDDGDITLYLCSNGGDLPVCMAIYDAMQSCRCHIRTVCMGVAASAAAVLLAAGTAGKRYCMPNGEIMIHQPRGMIQGEATDILLTARRFERKKVQLADLLAKHCARSRQSILTALGHDHWMNAEEALRFGLIDHIGKPDSEEETQ